MNDETVHVERWWSGEEVSHMVLQSNSILLIFFSSHSIQSNSILLVFISCFFGSRPCKVHCLYVNNGLYMSNFLRCLNLLDP